MPQPETGKSRRRLAELSLLVVVLGLALTPSPAAAAPLNDDYANRLMLQVGFADTRSNAGAGIEAAEPFTANDPAGLRCDRSSVSTTSGVQMDGTLWWEFVGDGGPMTVSTADSSFDTVLAVYETTGRVLVGCDDDVQPFDPTRPVLGGRVTSEIVVSSIAGRHYAVQVGGCSPGEACARTTSGDVTLRVSRTPTNDDRSDAAAITASAPISASNTGATLEPGEVASCGASRYAKTIWFRYTASAIGTAVISASGFDTVLAVYRGDSILPLACNDDAVQGQSGGSQVPASQPGGPALQVTPGDYLIQVGGYYDVGFDTVAARNGPLSVQVQFTEDVDLDDDGVNRDADCNDHDPTVSPARPEVPNNDVDENCDGVKAYDRDGDGVLAAPAGNDCRDDVGEIHPGARDVRGNGVDEDCSGSDAAPGTLDSVVRVHFDRRGAVIRFDVIRVVGLRPGTRMELRCRGRGCPFRVRDVRPRPLTSQMRLRLPDGHLDLRAGARLQLRMRAPEFLEKRWTYRVHRVGDPTLRITCIGPRGPQRCRQPE